MCFFSIYINMISFSSHKSFLVLNIISVTIFNFNLYYTLKWKKNHFIFILKKENWVKSIYKELKRECNIFVIAKYVILIIKVKCLNIFHKNFWDYKITTFYTIVLLPNNYKQRLHEIYCRYKKGNPEIFYLLYYDIYKSFLLLLEFI